MDTENIASMETAIRILVRDLGLHPTRARSIVEAMQRSARSNVVSMTRLLDDSDEPKDVLKGAVAALAKAGWLKTRFEPFHKRCDQRLGRDEESVAEIRRRANTEEYGRTCPNCHEWLNGLKDVKTITLYTLP